jgi:hypothetical protein
LNQTQKTSTGAYTSRDSNSISFRADITPGNSGGPVVLESTGEAIGVVTNSACTTAPYLANLGTAIDQSTLQSFLSSPIGPCDPYVPNFAFQLYYQPVQIWLPEPDPVLVTLQIVPGLQQVVPGSAFVHFRYSPLGAPFMSMPLEHIGGFDYAVELPPVACGDTPQLYFTATGTGGTQITKPSHAPEDLYISQVGVLRSLTSPLADFEGALPPGWTMSGLWGLASAPACGEPSACQGNGFAHYGLQASCTYNTGGPHAGSIMSPSLPLPPPQAGGLLELVYCSSLQSVAAVDAAQVVVNGLLVDTAPQMPVWAARTVNLNDFAGQSVTIEFRFTTQGPAPGGGSPRGWSVDGVQIGRSLMTCQACYPDCNASGGLTIADFACFQAKFAGADPYADCNGDSMLTIADFGCFQSEFVASCP